MARRPPPRWVAPVFGLFAAVLTAWTTTLALTLPAHVVARHYRISWVGFDVAELALLARVTWLAHRRRPQAELPAVALASLLVADAWFDITGAPTTRQLWEAVVLAVLVELPTAALCLLITLQVESGTSPWRRLTGAGRSRRECRAAAASPPPGESAWRDGPTARPGRPPPPTTPT